MDSSKLVDYVGYAGIQVKMSFHHHHVLSLTLSLSLMCIISIIIAIEKPELYVVFPIIS
jgi:hypothetical protein